jgi:hypothetical protein
LSTFVEIILGFPTVVFTVPLALAVFYWLLAIVGAVDLEIFDGLDGALDGAVDGAVDGLADAAVEGVADAVADAAADAAADALAEAAADGAAEAADAAGAGLAGPLVLLLNVLRVGKVPVTVSLTVFTLWGWLTGFLLTWLYRNVFGIGVLPHTAFALGALVFATVVALLLTNVAVRHLEPVFKTALGRTRDSLLGETAELTTGRVDPDFGQAALQIQGDDLVIQVRCDRPGNGLRRGDQVLIVSFDTRREAFVVEPLASARVQRTAATSPIAGVMPVPATREAPP